jgi:hypothetical protein
MEDTESTAPSDRQGGLKSNKKSSQKESDTMKASEAESADPAAASSESAERTTKGSSSSKKKNQDKKGKEKETETILEEKEDAAGSDSSSVVGASDADDDKASPKPTPASKKHIGVKSKTKSKKSANKTSSGKEKTTKKSTKQKKNDKSKKKSKVSSDSDSYSDSDSDSDTESMSSDSDASSDDEAKKKTDKKPSNLKNQFKALELQFAQLQQQLANSNNIASYGTSVNPYSFQHPSLPLLPNPLDSASAAARRSRRLPSRTTLSKLAEPQSSDLDEDSNDRTSGDKKSKDKKAKNPAFKRVDQVWDTNIHNYKLQDTADANNDAQYQDYIFHVRRTFDWEGKYRATVIDIKSKLLRECLQDVIGNVEGVSLVDETPRISPNLLFLYVFTQLLATLLLIL